MRRFNLLLTLLFLLASCGVSDKEKIDNAIEDAYRLLSDRKCSEAISVLNDVGYQAMDPTYISVYASAQACSSDFSEPNFFANDVDNIGASDSGFLRSLTKFSTSTTSSSTDSKYTSLQDAIDTILYAGNISSPSYTNRVAAFGSSAAKNLSAQALYMILVQMGKYFYLHGNTSTNGYKGERGDHNCITDYSTGNGSTARTNADASTDISPCNADNQGHSELASGAANRVKYMCQGIVLFNNFIDIIPNLIFSGSNSGSLSSLNITDTVCNISAGLTDLCSMKSQSACETYNNEEEMEIYFAWVFEQLLTDTP